MTTGECCHLPGSLCDCTGNAALSKSVEDSDNCRAQYVTQVTAKDGRLLSTIIKPLSTQSDGPICRICHEGANGEGLLSPCDCTGTLGTVHKSCLEKWLSSSNTSYCELCHTEFTIERRPRPLTEVTKVNAFSLTALLCLHMYVPVCLQFASVGPPLPVCLQFACVAPPLPVCLQFACVGPPMPVYLQFACVGPPLPVLPLLCLCVCSLPVLAFLCLCCPSSARVGPLPVLVLHPCCSSTACVSAVCLCGPLLCLCWPSSACVDPHLPLCLQFACVGPPLAVCL
uniref:E3 ubiquitin-protein ligase MARCHF2 n=1 Tax=Esox lucius TaxID=8010 RepID=A0AAY5K178_ESOLU